MKKIYLVIEDSKFYNHNGEVDYKTQSIFKAFENKERAEIFMTHLQNFEYEHRVSGIERVAYIKEVDFE